MAMQLAVQLIIIFRDRGMNDVKARLYTIYGVANVKILHDGLDRSQTVSWNSTGNKLFTSWFLGQFRRSERHGHWECHRLHIYLHTTLRLGFPKLSHVES